MEKIVATARVAAEANVGDVLWTNCLAVVADDKKDIPWDHDQLHILRDTMRLCIHPLRESRRILLFFEDKEFTGKAGKKEEGSNKSAILRGHRKQAEADIFRMCNELLGSERIRRDEGLCPDLRAQLTKVRADMHRYCAEVRGGTDETHAKDAEATYQTALAQSATFGPVDDTRLAICLNYSVFYREVLKSPDKACDIAKAAIDSALVDDSGEMNSRVFLMLQQNLKIWTAQIENPLSESTGRIGQEAL